jgi:signal transduction histidine kinase/ActR/RegA family two-component response regulator
MFAILDCVTQGHDLRLVLVAALICAVASVSAFGFQARSRRSSGVSRWAWAGLTGLVAGSGVWATHFTAMLAYQPSLTIRYEVLTTAASLIIAILGCGAGFATPLAMRGRIGALVGGAFTGFSIAAMHFTGIAAVRAQADILWDPVYVTASVIVGSLGGMAAFLAAGQDRRWSWAVGAVLLVLAICGLHFTAMAAVILQPDPRLALPQDVVGRGVLALATVSLAALILGAALSLLWMERLGRRTTLSGLKQALDAVPSTLAFYDASERLMVWNQSFTELASSLGIEAAAGLHRSEILAAAAKAGWFGAHAEASIRTQSNVRGLNGGAVDFRVADGRRLRFEGFRTQDGGMVTVISDVTEQRRYAEAMAAARDSAEAANRAKSEFLANMSHEIRTPLNGVLGVAEVLGRSRLTGKQRNLLGLIQQSGARLNALLADLLDLAQVDSGVAQLRPERTAVGPLVSSVLDLHAEEAAAKGLALRLEMDPAARGDVSVDPIRLQEVLGKLVGNGVKFTDAGEVVLGVSRHGEALSFFVSDTGPGFDDSRKELLFQRFRQADNTMTRRHEGAGLGLAICQQYVALMGGHLDCSSHPGEGATFSFSLEAPALPQAPAPAEPAIEPKAPGAFRVLVVDDNAVNRQMLELVLEAADIEHASAEDGQAAVEAMTTGGFDVVLMDIQMPVMDGLEATRRIRAWEHETRRPRAPIYIVSANCLKEHVEAGRAAGADGHFNKPIVVADLLAALEPHIARRAA